MIDLVAGLTRSVDRHGGRDALGVRHDDGWRWLTYRQLGHAIDEVRGGLAHRGIGPGDRVGILANNRVETAVTTYATLGLGACVVPMYPAQGPRDWHHILRDSGARLVVSATRGLDRRLEGLELPAVEHRLCFDLDDDDPRSFQQLRRDGRSHPYGPEPRSPDTLATLMYTSGTSGAPKGVMLTHHNLASNVEAVLAAMPLSSRDRCLSFLPWALAFGQTCELHAMLRLGASIAICSSLDRFVSDLAETKPTVLVSVPRMFSRLHERAEREMRRRPRALRELYQRGLRLAEKQREGRLRWTERVALETADRVVLAPLRQQIGGALRYAFCGGAPLAPDVARFVANVGITLYEGYGLTEASPVVSTNRPSAHRLGSVGRPVEGVRVHVDTSVGAEGDGEIVVHGPGVMKGYWNDPQATRAVLDDDGGLRTGDVGHLDEEGYLYVTGRLDEQYKLSSGKEVSPSVLEAQIRRSPYIKNAMVDGAGRDRNLAVVVVDLDAMHRWADERDLRYRDSAEMLDSPRVHAHILAEIGEQTADARPYERVADAVLVADDFTTDNGLLTPTLRIKRSEVRARYAEALEALGDG